MSVAALQDLCFALTLSCFLLPCLTSEYDKTRLCRWICYVSWGRPPYILPREQGRLRSIYYGTYIVMLNLVLVLLHTMNYLVHTIKSIS